MNNNDVVKDLEYARELFKDSALGDILEKAILEIEQLRRDTVNVASDMYSGVRR
jgi:hypothetical protein